MSKTTQQTKTWGVWAIHETDAYNAIYLGEVQAETRGRAKRKGRELIGTDVPKSTLWTIKVGVPK